MMFGNYTRSITEHLEDTAKRLERIRRKKHIQTCIKNRRKRKNKKRK